MNPYNAQHAVFTAEFYNLKKGKSDLEVTSLCYQRKKGMLAKWNTASNFNSIFAGNLANLSLDTICLKGQVYQPNY